VDAKQVRLKGLLVFPRTGKRVEEERDGSAGRGGKEEQEEEQALNTHPEFPGEGQRTPLRVSCLQVP
jgi:hypothetical protein